MVILKEDDHVDDNLDLLEAVINLHQKRKVLHRQALRRVAVKRLYQRGPIVTVCVDVVQKPLILLTLLLIFRIHSKTKIRVTNRTARPVRSLGPRCHNTTEDADPPSMKGNTFKFHYLLVVLRQRLILSGDVESNPGPLSQEIVQKLSTVDGTTFEKGDWNDIIRECTSLSANWKELSGYLGLAQSDIEAISCNNAKVSDCWNEALARWIKQSYDTERFGEPSWRSLLKAIVLVDKPLFNSLAAEHIVAAESAHVKSGSADEMETNHRGGRTGKKRVMDEKTELSQDEGAVSKTKKLKVESERECKPPRDHEEEEVVIPAVKPRLTFPMLDKKKMTKKDRKELKQRLHEESSVIIYKFQELFSATLISLKERKVTVTELSNHLRCLGPLKPTYNYYKCGYLGCELQEAKTVDDIMKIVSQFSSFFNYRMLENIINNLGSEQDRKNLAKYLDGFTEYAKRKVFECPCELGTMQDEGYSNMFIVLDETYENCSCNSLLNFKMDLKRILNIPPDVVINTCRIEPGSIKLTLQIPHFVQQRIFPLNDDQKTALIRLGVKQLSCGDYQFTNEEREGIEVDNSSNDEDSDNDDGQSMITDTGSSISIAVREKGKGGSSVADSGLGTCTPTRRSVLAAHTFSTKSLSTVEDKMERDLRDDPFLRMERDAAKPRPLDESNQFELHQASYRGELDEVKKLMERKKLNPLEKDNFGYTALHYAAGGGRLDVTRFFIEEQSLVPACRGWHGWTPLHAAAHFNYLQIVEYLVDKQQVDPECQDEDGYIPLHRACFGGATEVVRYLVNEMSKLTPLKDVLYHRTKLGSTPLHLAARYGHLKVVQLFISEFDVDPNSPGWKGRLALHSAAQGGYLNIMKYLIEEKKCDPSCCNEEDRTPLHVAARKGQLHIVKYLTQNKHCNPLDKNSFGNAPLHESAACGHLNVVDFFISQLNCDPNTSGRWGMTPLHYAAHGGFLDTVKYLIEEKRCNPSCLDERKTTPLHFTAGKGHLHLVTYLIKKQHCNPLSYDKLHGTPLHWAAFYGQLDVVQYLIENRKCPQNIRGPRNTTPLEEAREQGHTNIVEYLTSQSHV